MVAALLAFLGTKLGRTLALIGGAILLAVLFAAYFTTRGAARQKIKQQIETLQANNRNLKERRDAEADASRRTADERRERVRKYARRD